MIHVNDVIRENLINNQKVLSIMNHDACFIAKEMWVRDKGGSFTAMS